MATDAEELARRVFHEGTSSPNPRHVLDEIFAQDFACHGPPGMEHSHAGGAEGLEECIFANAFEDLSFTVQGVESDGDRVVVSFAARGRQVADYRGVPPRDEEMRTSGVATFRIAGDKIAEGWGTLNWG